jgi:hypothetical protein
MITHAAIVLTSTPPGSDPAQRRGMPVAMCGFDDDGRGVLTVWDRGRVDCIMCRTLMNATPPPPIVAGPGGEIPMRHSRPDYVPAHYAYSPITAPEFTDEHPRGHGALRVLLLVFGIVVVSLLFAGAVALLSTHGESRLRPDVVTTPTTHGGPPDETGR